MDDSCFGREEKEIIEDQSGGQFKLINSGFLRQVTIVSMKNYLFIKVVMKIFLNRKTA